MELQKLLDKIIANIGYKNFNEFFLKYILPLTAVILFFFFIAVFVLTMLPVAIPYLILFAGLTFMFMYPYIQFEKKNSNINENMHLFITYAGTIATMDINRHLLFLKVAEKKTLGEIAVIAEKVEYFAKRWNLGFAKTCRKIAELIPSKMFGDFLDRLAIMLDFGESLDTFLNDEQIAVMDDFAASYKKSLENLRTLQEIFMSLTMALGFMMSIGLILPLISDTSIDVVVRYAVFALLILDIVVLVFVYAFIPSDKLFQNSDVVDAGSKLINKWILICFPISFLLLLTMFIFNFLPFLVNVAIGITPLLAIGAIAQKAEDDIFTKDKAYSPFIRSFGSAIEIKSGAVVTALRSLQVHDFGPLNQVAVELYRRLKTGNNKYKSWEHFCAESGSNLIYQFSQIFSEAIFLGGQPEQIGEIVSVNFLKLLSLRKLKLQLVSGLRGSFYGSLVGFSAAGYISAQIASMLSGLFSMTGATGGDSLSGSVMQAISPATAAVVDMEVITVYIGIMIIIHAIVSSIILKIADGGSIYASLFDIVLMIWVGAIISWVLPLAIKGFLPGMGEMMAVAAGS